MTYIIPNKLQRRDFLRILGGAAAFSALPRPVRASGAPLHTVSVLHTTDLHGHILPTSTYEGVEDVGGIARCATQIHLWKKRNPHHVLIDAGDVYQGTQVGLSTQGRVMIDTFNHLNYDAWVIGNHEFDWGMDAVNGVLTASAMPALCANSTLDGKPAGALDDPAHPLSRVQPYIVKNVGGFKIGVIGVTTTGMPYWFHEKLYQGFEFLDPIKPVRNALRELRAQDVDAVIIAGHMGLRRGGDDFANRTESLTKEFPEVAAFIGGHTHRDVPHETVNGIPFTQANYFGINAGRLDITFDKDTRKIKWVQPMTELMDDSIALDPAVLSLTRDDIDYARTVTSTPVGTLKETLSIDNDVGRPSEVEELIAAAIMEAMEERGVDVGGVIHGLIFPDGDFPAGDKTIGDLWDIMPYENKVVTARLDREELALILHEIFSGWRRLSLMGMTAEIEGRGQDLKIKDIHGRDGQPLEAGKRYTVAFNSYDAQSGGQGFMQLRDILRRPDSRMKLHPVQTREALIDYFTAREAVTPISPARHDTARAYADLLTV